VPVTTLPPLGVDALIDTCLKHDHDPGAEWPPLTLVKGSLMAVTRTRRPGGMGAPATTPEEVSPMQDESSAESPIGGEPKSLMDCTAEDLEEGIAEMSRRAAEAEAWAAWFATVAEKRNDEGSR
jgi:hypothetical protein